jgi:L-seryl-tRNA(Ser) seleniumtransferase
MSPSDANGGPERAPALVRSLPAVDRLLSHPAGSELLATFGRDQALRAVRQVVQGRRSRLLQGEPADVSAESLIAEAEALIRDLISQTLVPVINATGVILHTNLGRAPLSQRALEAIREAALGYVALEYDLEEGTRGARFVHAERLLLELTGAESALVVNNNAAAVLLMLTAVCRGSEVLISRGQLVEIGGGFRVPEIMAQSGASLVEVGTTNRTHLRDYSAALTERTAAILVAHHSNFKIVGFTTEPALGELAELAHARGIPLLYDLGSGSLLDTSTYGLDKEPTVPEALASGADLVAFSGDKLLGGPQAGIICGRGQLMAGLREHPLNRSLRPDKLCLAALSATLKSYALGAATAEVPVWQMIARPAADIRQTAERWSLGAAGLGFDAEVIAAESTVGGGSLPGSALPTWSLALAHPRVDELAGALRREKPSVIGRIVEDRLLLDPRTVLAHQEAAVVDALRSVKEKGL